jgi:hypothetical protein
MRGDFFTGKAENVFDSVKRPKRISHGKEQSHSELLTAAAFIF